MRKSECRNGSRAESILSHFFISCACCDPGPTPSNNINSIRASHSGQPSWYLGARVQEFMHFRRLERPDFLPCFQLHRLLPQVRDRVHHLRSSDPRRAPIMNPNMSNIKIVTDITMKTVR
eukprot:1861208-Rhodomonas_salina.5